VTVDLAREWIGGGLVVIGGLFMLIGAVGILRMPDVFTRMHAASVADTLGAGLTLVGLMLIAGLSLVTVKLGFLVLFFGLISPVSTHAIARAALHGGIKPDLSDEDAARIISEEAPPSKP
jgi:multicomponent Na+:H+ antiporter subunit G